MESKTFRFDVFLSYSHQDKEIVTKLAERLRKDGLRVWFDGLELRPGSHIQQSIESGLEESRALVFCMSKGSFSSDWAQLEARTFRFRDPLNKDRRFIPIRLDDGEIPTSLAQFLYVDWRNPEEESYQRLRDACLPPPQPIVAKTEDVPRKSADSTKGNSPPNGKLGAFLINAETLYFAASDGFIWFRELGNGGSMKRLPTFCGRVAALACSDGTLIAAGKDKLLHILDADGKGARSLAGHNGPVLALASDAHGLAYSGAADHMIRKWDVPSGNSLAVYHGHTGPVRAVAVNQHWIVSGSDDSTVRVWDHSGKCTRILEGHVGPIFSVAASEDGCYALSGSSDCTLRLWDTWSGYCIRIFQGHTDTVTSIALHPNRRHVLTGSGDRTLRLWDLSTGKCVNVLDGHRGDVSGIYWIGKHRAISADHMGWYSWGLKEVDFDVDAFRPDSAEGDVEAQVQYTNAKVLLVGESGAGKSSLSLRLATNEWDANTESTNGAWATQWKLPLEQANGIEREIWLWDFGGQSDQRIIHQLYMADAALAVLVFNGQKDELFDSIGQWDRDVGRASPEALSKILVASRKDAGSLKFSRKQVEQFGAERGFKAFLETSAKTGEGCNELRAAIVDGIDWDRIPWRSSPMLFKRLKEQIVNLKESGHVLMRFNELRDRLKLELGTRAGQFTDEQLKAVLSLLAGPGVVAELEFGGWILFQPELINAYGQALIQTIRGDPSELGCILEDKVLRGELTFATRPQISNQDEQFILLAMHKQLVERGLCLRQQTERGPLLVLPAFYRRQRPAIREHPPIIVSYEFDGYSDEIHATLVVHLIHTNHFKQDELWKDAADFKTPSGTQIGIRFSALREGKGRIDVYAEQGLGIGQTIQFIGYVHEHLRQRAKNVVRKRHYNCPSCDNPVNDLKAVAARLELNKTDILCVYCEGRVPLWDELERIYKREETVEAVRVLEKQVDVALDNESKERVLVGEVMSAVALAGHISREKTVSDYGIDMEIEFKDAKKLATGEMLFLQLKSGDSHLERRASDGANIFRIRNERHARYWMDQKFPVLLVIRNSKGEIAWMEIRDYLKEVTNNGKKPVSQIIFKGEPFNVQSIHKWKQRLLPKA